MEILPTLALVPGAPAQPETIASGGDDPFLALLAGLMQPPAQPSAPLAINGWARRRSRGSGRFWPNSDTVVTATTDATSFGLQPARRHRNRRTGSRPDSTGHRRHKNFRRAARAAGDARNGHSTHRWSQLSSRRLCRCRRLARARPPSAAAPKAETAAAGGELRPKAVTASHRRQPDRSGEDQVLSDDPGEVPTTVAPVPASVAPADARTAETAPAHSPGLDPSDLAAPVPEAGAAPVPANESRPPDTPATRRSRR